MNLCTEFLQNKYKLVVLSYILEILSFNMNNIYFQKARDDSKCNNGAMSGPKFNFRKTFINTTDKFKNCLQQKIIGMETQPVTLVVSMTFSP